MNIVFTPICNKLQPAGSSRTLITCRNNQGCSISKLDLDLDLGNNASSTLLLNRTYRTIGFVHLRKAYSLKMSYLLCEYHKQNTFRVHIPWFVLLFFGTVVKKDVRKAVTLYKAKSCFCLELDTKA